MMRSSKSKDSSSTASTIDRKPVICRIGSGDEDSEDTNTEDDSKLFKPITISSNKMQKNNTYDRLSSTLIANRGNHCFCVCFFF